MAQRCPAERRSGAAVGQIFADASFGGVVERDISARQNPGRVADRRRAAALGALAARFSEPVAVAAQLRAG
jgi:hypothetical protein